MNQYRLTCSPGDCRPSGRAVARMDNVTFSSRHGEHPHVTHGLVVAIVKRACADCGIMVGEAPVGVR